jgi:FemAB-related protein (PEP-CTERM system-associated)
MADEPLVLRTLEAPDPRWDALVRAHPEGSFFHLLPWKRVIERAFPGHRPHYLYVERGSRWVGVLPLFAAGGRPFSRALVSVPIGVHGGVLAEDAAAAELLRQGAREIAVREGLAYVEYKSEKRLFDGLPTKDDLYFVFRQELFGDREKQLSVIPRKTRAVLRESERAHLVGSYNRDDLEPFYDLYALSMRNLGTPMFPKELFVASLEELGPACDLVTVRQCGRIIGCVMNYYHRQVMMPFFAGTLPDARDAGVNNWIYWFMLETGHDLGYRVFDFGRSKAGTGAFKFKKHFGMDEQPLAYQYDLVGAEALPNVNPTNPKYEKAIETWQRLPVELTKWVGPLIQRRLP